jgi:hypothetical protein
VKRKGNRRDIGAELRNPSACPKAILEAWRAHEATKIYEKVKMPLTLREEANNALGLNRDAASLKPRDNMAEHIYACETEMLRGPSEQCNFCGVMVNSDDSDDAKFVRRLEICRVKVYAKLLRKRYMLSASVSIMLTACFNRNGFPLKHQITIDDNHTYTIFFCPYCLDVELNWDKRNLCVQTLPFVLPS